MLVPDTIHPTSGDLLPLPFRRLKIILIVGIDAEQLTESFRLEVNCP